MTRVTDMGSNITDIGVNINAETATATVYIGGCDFEITSREQLKQVAGNFDQLFRFIESAEFGLPDKPAEPESE